MDTHENQGGIQVFIVFLLEVPIVFFYLSLKLVVELHPGIDSGSGATDYRLQGTAKGLLQSFTGLIRNKAVVAKMATHVCLSKIPAPCVILESKLGMGAGTETVVMTGYWGSPKGGTRARFGRVGCRRQ